MKLGNYKNNIKLSMLFFYRSNIVIMNDYSENNLSETLRQGIKFKKGQNNIINKTEKKMKTGQESESESIIENFGNYIENSKALINDEYFKQRKMDELTKLQTEFKSTLAVYDALQVGIVTKSREYIQTSSSPYLNKNIRFPNNVVDYVTAAGVRKYYVNPTILNATAGKNGCPIASELTQLSSNDIPVGTQLGSNMIQGQSCGNEGKNVRVTATVNDSTTRYVGCYKDNPSRAMSNSMTNGSNNYSYETCKSAATAGGYKYFGLQNVLADGKAQCFVSNNLNQAQKYGVSIIQNQEVLWSSGTATGKKNVAKLTHSGTLTITSPSGQVLFTSPNAPGDCENGGKINSIVATYGGNCNGKPLYVDCGGRGPGTYNVPYGNATNNITKLTQILAQFEALRDSRQIKNYGGDSQKSFDYIAAQGFQSDPAYCCAKMFDYSYKCGNVTKSGRVGAGQNINFNCINESAKCVFFLMLQDDGNMCIYRGSDPTNNKGNIWCTSTNGRQQDPNPNWTALKGKTRVNYINSGMTLNSGEWIGSTNGSLLLYMQEDGNLVLYTSKPVSNCSAKSDGYQYGGGWANAVYNLAEQGYPALVGKVGYINKDAILSEYPSTMLNADGSIKNLSSTCSSNVQNIDSIKWKNYTKSSNKMSPTTICGLSKELENDNIRLNQLHTTLGGYASEIIKHISYLESLNIDIIRQMGIDKTTYDQNIATYKKYNSEFSTYITNDVKNINGIVSDSDIVSSYENYSYMLWSILAISILLITMKIIRK